MQKFDYYVPHIRPLVPSAGLPCLKQASGLAEQNPLSCIQNQLETKLLPVSRVVAGIGPN